MSGQFDFNDNGKNDAFDSFVTKEIIDDNGNRQTTGCAVGGCGSGCAGTIVFFILLLIIPFIVVQIAGAVSDARQKKKLDGYRREIENRYKVTATPSPTPKAYRTIFDEPVTVQ